MNVDPSGSYSPVPPDDGECSVNGGFTSDKAGFISGFISSYYCVDTEESAKNQRV